MTARRLSSVLVLTLALGGCGIAATDFHSEVRTVQAHHEARLSTLTKQATRDLAGQPDAAAADLAALADELTRFTNEVAALKTPDADRASIGALLVAYRALTQATRELRTAVVARDRTLVAQALVSFNAAAGGEQAAVDAFNGT